jgi:hypothetical protein
MGNKNIASKNDETNQTSVDFYTLSLLLYIKRPSTAVVLNWLKPDDDQQSFELEKRSRKIK